MKWLIVEDALRDRKGHWLEYVSTFVRGLTALGDEVVVLCNRQAEAFILEQTGALPVLPESIWHRMGDGAGALKRYLRVPRHAIATFFAMRKALSGFNHNRARGQVRERATGGWPEGRGSRNERVKGHRGFYDGGTDNTGMEAGQSLDKPSGATFSNPSTSELARDSENTSLNRSASGAAPALDAGRWTLDLGEAPDWIFVPTVLVHHLLGWWLLLKTGSVPRESRVLLFFPNLPIRLDESGKADWTGGPTTKLMAWLLARLRGDVESGKLVLGVETHAMRRALESLIQIPVVYLPHPVEAAQPPRTDSGRLRTEVEDQNIDSSNNPLSAICHPPSGYAKPIVFGCYGAARWEKGSDVFLEAIKLILKNEVESDKWRVSTDSRMVPAEARRGGEGKTAKNLTTEDTESTEAQFFQKQVCAWAGQAGAPESDSLASELADSPVSESHTRFASIPAAQPDTSYPLLVTADGRPLRFAIQWVEDFRDGEGNQISIDPWLKNHPQVEVIGRYFLGNEYERRLAATDVMVLPYRSPYRLRVSRVVIEAMIHGMPVIATEGTTLFEQAEEHGVVVGCEEGSAESLARAILKFAEQYHQFLESSSQKVLSASLHFSIDAFRSILLKKVDCPVSLDEH
jgi:glycosyltransferase involved in cell wall biosynthesis